MAWTAFPPIQFLIHDVENNHLYCDNLLLTERVLGVGHQQNCSTNACGTMFQSSAIIIMIRADFMGYLCRTRHGSRNSKAL